MNEAARQGSGHPGRRRRDGRGEAARRAAGVSSPATAARILVADDEPALRDMLGELLGGVEADEGELRESRERLAALSGRAVNLLESERREIALELHDQIGQLLTGLRFMIEAPRAGGREEMLSVINELVDRVSDLSMNLRPPMLDELGLLPALLCQIERFGAQTGIQVDFHHSNLDRRFGPQAEITAFRIVQEALTNVARHAGVMKVEVEVWADSKTLAARIEDDGRGFSVDGALARYSCGLAGMRERGRLVRGALTIKSRPDSGTRLSLQLPLSASASKAANQ